MKIPGKKSSACLLAVIILFTQLVSCSDKKNDAPAEPPKLEYSTKAQAGTQKAAKKTEPPAVKIVNNTGTVIGTRFNTPVGYDRVVVGGNTFGAYLRGLPLKPDGTGVKFFDGRVKENRGVYEAVIDIDVGERDLQQCADAVMRLWAEYLYKNQRYSEIHFNFVNGFRTEYTKWMEGYRITVEGNKAWWVKRGNPSNTYRDFRSYMDMVFAYAGTLSLIKELKPVDIKDMEPGDVFIDQGHSIIVIDMAEEKDSGRRLFMLAQSYMPAQDIQVLKNPADGRISPWYSLDFGEELHTPEWKFKKSDLRRFEGAARSD